MARLEEIEAVTEAILSCNSAPGPKLTHMMAWRRARAAIAALDAARSTQPVCSTCGGGGEVVERGHSLNPGSGTLVADPQCDIDHVCPDCDGTGERPA